MAVGNNFSAIIQKSAVKFPDREALRIPVQYNDEQVDLYEHITYGEFWHKVNQYRTGLHKEGFREGDRIILMLPPCVDLYCLFVALMASGMVVVLFDMSMGVKKVLTAIKESRSIAVISNHALLKYRFLTPPIWKCKKFSVDKTGLGVKPLSHLLCPEPEDIPIVECHEDQKGLITYTSGSTGRAKGADRTHSSLIAQHLALKKYLEYGPDDIDMTCFPVVGLHNLSCGITTVFPALNFKSVKDVQPEVIIHQVQNFGVCRLSGPPAYLGKIADYMNHHQVKLPGVKSVGVGGATVSSDLGKRLRKAFGDADIESVYGSTEAEPISHLGIDEVISTEGKGFLVGKPVDILQVAMVNLPKTPGEINESSLKDYKAGQGEIGEIIVKGPHVLKQYVENPEATRENKIPCEDGQVWHRTGDTGYLDEIGRIWLTGRVADVLSFEGQQVQPYLLEIEVDNIKGVERSALVQTEDTLNTSLFVKLKDTENQKHIEEKIQACLDQVKCSGITIRYIEEIPFDFRHNSKINRPRLREKLSKITSSAKKEDLFIVRLNPVDLFTLSGVAIAALSAALLFAGYFSFSLSVIFIAMLVDALDGILARKYGTERNFGRYLDGFADTLYYLVIPGLFLYQWGFNTWYYGLVIILFIICGIVRLSVFNEIGNVKDDDDQLSYKGMPVFWSLLFLGMIYLAHFFTGKAILFPFVAVLFSVYSLLMVYNRQFFKFKDIRTILGIVIGGSAVLALCGIYELFRPFETAHLTTAFVMMFPPVVGGVLHMVGVTKDWLPGLKIPVHEAWFGANKTWRGFVLMVIFSILGAYILKVCLWDMKMTVNLENYSFIYMGIVLGLSYVLFELPNSFLKRRLGIQPGETPESLKYLFIFFDQFDSGLGIAVFSVIFFNAPFITGLLIAVLFPIVALVIKRFLFLMEWKKSYI